VAQEELEAPPQAGEAAQVRALLAVA